MIILREDETDASLLSIVLAIEAEVAASAGDSGSDCADAFDPSAKESAGTDPDVSGDGSSVSDRSTTMLGTSYEGGGGKSDKSISSGTTGARDGEDVWAVANAEAAEEDVAEERATMRGLVRGGRIDSRPPELDSRSVATIVKGLEVEVGEDEGEDDVVDGLWICPFPASTITASRDGARSCTTGSRTWST